MEVRHQIFAIPRALAAVVESGKADYQLALRKVRWGDGPMFIVGHGDSYFAALTGAHAFESLMGCPVLARSSLEFTTYSAFTVQPHSIFCAISKSGETPETLEAITAARTRGAQVLAMTSNSAGAVAAAADYVFLSPTIDSTQAGQGSDLVQHAAIGYAALLAARLLKRHHRQLDTLETEFANLPATVERIQIQLSDAVLALAGEVQGVSQLAVLGAGFYYPVALQSASLLQSSAMKAIVTVNVAERRRFPFGGSAGALFLSGTGCRLKKIVHSMAAEARRNGGAVLAVTDGNDRELLNESGLAILLPGASEMAGALLALAAMESAAFSMQRGTEIRPDTGRDRRD